MKVTAIAFDEKQFDVFRNNGFPAPVHKVEFECDLAGLGHVAAANRLERLFFDIDGIDRISGIRVT